eukprot:TRINITY_DN619_c0_g3_i2.p1 TRINITY_DN619_c0_g3~~TRINITY_DN619_c0_g3_i2.p1  ORF type:complete len:215 (+),score=55.03 TRINITY_DN619_c0_g3_i2:46-690(+)
MSRTFANGPYTGSFSIQGKRREMFLEINYHRDSSSLSGKGTDDFGDFTISGEFNQKPPYAVKMQRTDATGKMEMDGFRDASGGVFGNWKGSMGSGDFSMKPADKESAVYKKFVTQQMESKIDQLKNLGFEDWLCTQALEENNNDVDRAIDWITRQTSAAAGGVGSSKGESSESSVDSDAVATLMGMGFSKEQAQQALSACNNDVTQAVDLLFSQ